MRRMSILLVIVLLVVSCGDDETVETAATATTTSTVTTTAPTTAPRTTVAPATTRTTFDAPPATAPNPERGPFVGIWRWPNTHTRYIELFEHGVVATGSIVDNSLQFTRFGEWDVSDGVMSITSLQLGFEGCDESPGTYAIRISGQNLVMEILDEPCEGRAVWLIGLDLTKRTWLADDAVAP